MTIPALQIAEPLQVECQHFIDCIRTGQRPLTDARQGLAVVRVLQAAQRSMHNGGSSMPIGEE